MVRHQVAFIVLLILAKARDISASSKNAVAEVTSTKISVHSSSKARKVAAAPHLHLPSRIAEHQGPLSSSDPVEGASTLMRRAESAISANDPRPEPHPSGSHQAFQQFATPLPVETSEALRQSFEEFAAKSSSPLAAETKGPPIGLGPVLPVKIKSSGKSSDRSSTTGGTSATPTTHRVWVLGTIAICINVVVTLAVFILLKTQKPVAATIAAGVNSSATNSPQVEYPQQQEATTQS